MFILMISAHLKSNSLNIKINILTNDKLYEENQSNAFITNGFCYW